MTMPEASTGDTLLTSDTPAATATAAPPAVDLSKTGSAMDAALAAGATAREAAAALAAKDKPAEGDKPKEGDKPALTAEEQAAADAKAAEDADKAAKEAADKAPETYEEFKLPEGLKLDEAVVGDFKSLAKELNLSQEKAQKLIDIGARMQTGNIEAIKNVIDTQAKAWRAETVADTEFGGDNLDKNLATAKAALDEFGTPALKTLLATTKLGSHPEVVRLLFRAGQAISQDGFIPGRQRAAAGDTASTLYPSSAKK